MANILALGGAGFIGSYVARELLQAGHHVTIVDNFSKYGHIQHDFYLHPHCDVQTKDVRNMRPDEFRSYDVVLCLAALIGGIKYFHRIPYQIARDNTQLVTHAIDCTLAAARGATFVYFSSSMIYERLSRPATEEDARTQPVPITNYGMQKLFGEFITRGAHEELGLNYLILRPFNAVGSGELPHRDTDGQVEFGMAHVVPDFIYKALLKQSPFHILGDGQQVRTFTHAKDIADALRLMLERGICNDDYNICGNNTYNMSDLAKIIWKKVNPDQPFGGFMHEPVPPSDVRYRVGVSDKAREHLGWEPQYDLDHILNDSLPYVRQGFHTSA